jgi:hypothetical protein
MDSFLSHAGLATQICGMFAIIVLPVYLVMRYFVKLIRLAYGFDGAEADDGPPLRICSQCHNTVLEDDFTHCPYCGNSLASASPTAAASLPVADDAAGTHADAAAGSN